MKYLIGALLALTTALSITRPSRAPAYFFNSTFRNWGLEKIQAPEAWSLAKQMTPIPVAVIDTGVDSSIVDLTFKMNYDKQKMFGWDFVANKKNPSDEHGHGTHVAGIIGAATNTATGVSGVAKNALIMAVKYYSDTATGAVNLRNTVSSIEYAVEHGVKVINYSGGGPEFSESEYLAIKKAEAKGILFVAAAGNESKNADQIQDYYYPCAYRISSVICVAATGIDDKLIPSSNWGPKHVEVAAPGENIFSTLPGGEYGTMSGTSQATAFVSGLAVLLWSENPRLTAAQIKLLIMDSAEMGSLKGKVASGRINARRAVSLMEQRFPVGSTKTHFTRATIAP